jgi:hypothetical protein
VVFIIPETNFFNRPSLTNPDRTDIRRLWPKDFLKISESERSDFLFQPLNSPFGWTALASEISLHIFSSLAFLKPPWDDFIPDG